MLHVSLTPILNGTNERERGESKGEKKEKGERKEKKEERRKKIEQKKKG